MRAAPWVTSWEGAVLTITVDNGKTEAGVVTVDNGKTEAGVEPAARIQEAS